MRSLIFICIVMFICACAAAGSAAHPAYTVLREFRGGRSSADPYSPLIADLAGNLYGTASTGGNGGCVRYGSTGCGTVFQLTPPSALNSSWTEKVLFRFPGGNGPWLPTAGLTMDTAGNLFGMTTDGAPLSCFTKYCGTAFELTPPSKPGGSWTESVLYRFPSDGSAGYGPDSGLTRDGSGNLYGTTQYYGPLLHGEVFRLTPPAKAGGRWTETTLSGFENGGALPLGGVVFDNAGNLYGTTYEGGSQNFGTIFELKHAAHPSGRWTQSVLYEFGSNACYPKTDLVFDRHGNLYGTAQGCPRLRGAVFRLTPPPKPGGSWSEAVLAYFEGTSNFDPTTSVVLDDTGNVYGTTASGGTYGKGTVFELKAPNWAETVLHSFTGADGYFPIAGPIFGPGGALYGTVWEGGYRGGVCKIGDGCGVVFKVSP